MGSRRKDPVLLLRCDMTVSSAVVHLLSSGASAAQGDALSLQAKLLEPI